MNISILHGINGAQKAEGLVVIIDVFRASSTIIACFHRNAGAIIPVETVKEARKIKKNHPTWLLVGERDGKKLDEFDYGNSPANMIKTILLNKTIIFTTSSGTKGILYANNADECIIASFTNISKVISYINEKNPSTVSLVPMGLNGKTPALEDDFCADIIRNRVHSNQKESNQTIYSVLKNSEGIKRLQRLDQEDDINYCLNQDIFHHLPIYDREKNVITIKRN